VKSYPRGYSTKELEESIDKNGSVNVDSFTIAPSFFAKAALGLTELERRNASRFGWWSLSISIFATILSVIAVVFAYLAYHDSDQWRVDQLKVLNEINRTLSTKK